MRAAGYGGNRCRKEGVGGEEGGGGGVVANGVAGQCRHADVKHEAHADNYHPRSIRVALCGVRT